MFNAAAFIKLFLKNVRDRIFEPLYNQRSKLLENEIIGSCQTLLDIGCGPSSPINKFSSSLQYTVGIDLYKPHVNKSREAKIHCEYKVINALDIEYYFQPKSFDCVLAADLIEHLSKEDGLKLIDMMNKIAKNKVIICTPNGFLPQHGYADPYSDHLSGWEVEDMSKLGFRILGINGWKVLRGEVAVIKWRPAFFWEKVSLLTQILVTKYPKYAFHLLCIKDMKS